MFVPGKTFESSLVFMVKAKGLPRAQPGNTKGGSISVPLTGLD